MPHFPFTLAITFVAVVVMIFKYRAPKRDESHSERAALLKYEQADEARNFPLQ